MKYLEICLKIYELDAAKFLSVPGLAWPAGWKKSKVKLDLSTDIGMLFIVEKTLFHSIYQYAKANNKYIKFYSKKKNHHIFSIGM